MSIEDEIKESLEKKDVDKFREIITRPKIYINDVFGNGILHYILADHKDTPIEFIQVLLEQEPLNLNKVHSESRVPPLLCTDREDIQDVILGNVKCNVNKAVNEKNMMCWALENKKLGLLKKLIDHPQIDLLGENDTDEENNAFVQSMKNPAAFKLFLESPKINVQDGVGWNGIIVPLEYSLKKKWIESTLLLLERGADMNIQIQDGLTIAETIIAKGNESLIKFVLDNLDKVKQTENLLLIAIIEKKNSFTYSSMENDIDLIGKLIGKKCLLNNRCVVEALGSLDVLKRIIDYVDEEINFEEEKILVDAVLRSDNIEIVNKLLGKKFALKHKAFILELLDKIINPLVINSILSIDELVKEHVLVIFTRSSYSMFVTLLKMGEPGIERINHLLDISSVKLPLMFPPLGLLIKTGTELTINLAKKLLENHGVIPQSVKEMDYFIENERMDILEFLIRKEIRLNVFGKTLTIKSFMELVKLLGDNTELRDMLITKTILTDKGKDIVIHSIKQFIDFQDETSELLLLIVRGFGVKLDDMLFREPFDGSKNLLFELLEGLPSEKYINGLIDIIKTSPLPNLVNRIRDLNLLYRYIELDNIDLIRLLIRNSDLVASVNVKHLIEWHMYAYLREICEALEPEKINLEGAIPIVLSDIPIDSDAIFSNDVLGTIVRHPRFNPNEIYEDEHGRMNTQLQLLLEPIERVETQQMVEYVISIFQEVLKNPKTDLNQLNGPVNNENTQSVLDRLLIDYIHYIRDYEEKEYQSDQPFHMILQMILRHPRLNMTPHYHFHRAVCAERLGDLFTHMISIADFDMDAAFLLHIICSEGNDVFLSVLLTLQTFDMNYSAGGETALHVCLKYDKDDCAKMLIEDPRIDLSIIEEGKNYAELATQHNRLAIVELLRTRGIRDDRAERMAMEAAEYDARMAAIGRPKHGRLKELLDIYDDILKERENPEADFDENTTKFSKSLCPFCLVSLEKEDPRDCVYLSGHKCHPDVRNEALMAKYLGPEWGTTHFEVCCTCGRPGKTHGHFRIVPDGEVSSLVAPGALVSHWRCDQYNGGGGKEEMVTRLVGILSYLKARIDSEEHLEDNAELSRQLALEADKALFDQSMKDRAVLIFQNRAWNANSTIAPYKRFNAPRVAAAASARVEEVREPIVHFDNRLKPADKKDSCGLCLVEERDDLYKSHESDTTYICGVCLYKTVCIVPYRNVTCGSGCIPKKQIHKADVEALMDGQLCQLMAPIAAAEEAQAAQERQNYNARRAGRNNRNDDLEEGEIRDDE
jgi:ankyrin repeat protein